MRAGAHREPNKTDRDRNVDDDPDIEGVGVGGAHERRHLVLHDEKKRTWFRTPAAVHTLDIFLDRRIKDQRAVAGS